MGLTPYIGPETTMGYQITGNETDLKFTDLRLLEQGVQKNYVLDYYINSVKTF